MENNKDIKKSDNMSEFANEEMLSNLIEIDDLYKDDTIEDDRINILGGKKSNNSTETSLTDELIKTFNEKNKFDTDFKSPFIEESDLIIKENVVDDSKIDVKKSILAIIDNF